MANKDLEHVLGFAGNGRRIVTWQRYAYWAQTIEQKNDPKRRINVLHTYDRATGKALRSVRLPSGELSVTLSPDGSTAGFVRGSEVLFRRIEE